MSLPALPLGLTLWRAAALGALTYAAYQRGKSSRRAPDPLAELPEGLGVTPTAPEKGLALHARIRRKIPFGQHLPDFEIDAAVFGRILIRKT